jgi:hypothetical protein
VLSLIRPSGCGAGKRTGRLATILAVTRKSAIPLFWAACSSLFLTGLLLTGAIIRLLSFPLGLVDLILLALLWGIAGNRTGALYYWIGVPFMVLGSFRFGMDAGNINALVTRYAAPENLPPYPNIPLELLLGAIPTALVFFGLKRSGLGRVAGVLFLLNPAILFIGMWLRLPVSL